MTANYRHGPVLSRIFVRVVAAGTLPCSTAEHTTPAVIGLTAEPCQIPPNTPTGGDTVAVLGARRVSQLSFRALFSVIRMSRPCVVR